jgi:hypothetical protein
MFTGYFFLFAPSYIFLDPLCCLIPSIALQWLTLEGAADAVRARPIPASAGSLPEEIFSGSGNGMGKKQVNYSDTQIQLKACVGSRKC